MPNSIIKILETIELGNQSRNQKINKTKAKKSANWKLSWTKLPNKKKQPTQQKRKIKDKLQSRLNYENGPLRRQPFHFSPNLKVGKVSKLVGWVLVFEHDFPSLWKSYQIESNSKTTRFLDSSSSRNIPMNSGIPYLSNEWMNRPPQFGCPLINFVRKYYLSNYLWK